MRVLHCKDSDWFDSSWRSSLNRQRFKRAFKWLPLKHVKISSHYNGIKPSSVQIKILVHSESNAIERTTVDVKLIVFFQFDCSESTSGALNRIKIITQMSLYIHHSTRCRYTLKLQACREAVLHSPRKLFKFDL